MCHLVTCQKAPSLTQGLGLQHMDLGGTQQLQCTTPSLRITCNALQTWALWLGCSSWESTPTGGAASSVLGATIKDPVFPTKPCLSSTHHSVPGLSCCDCCKCDLRIKQCHFWLLMLLAYNFQCVDWTGSNDTSVDFSTLKKGKPNIYKPLHAGL
jgi:hypothetical protein